jgi:hypothetical protein
MVERQPSAGKSIRMSCASGTTSYLYIFVSLTIHAILRYAPKHDIMRLLIGVTLLVIGTSAVALGTALGTPEIDPASAGSALALLAGALVIIQGRRKR